MNWKDVSGYEGLYQVSDAGIVKSMSRIVGSRERSTGINHRTINPKNICLQPSHGYLRVTLCSEGVNRRYMVHRLVGIAFIPTVENKPFINHKNGIKTDNRVENLEWCSWSENNKHACSTGLKVTKKGAESPLSKYSQDVRIKVVKLLESGLSLRKASKIMDIPHESIRKIKNNFYAQQ